MTGLSALLLGVLMHMRWGYNAGDNDHLVLSPVGMRWANPDWFKNDWTVDNAPQPHWLFDIVTFLGVKLGSVAAVYFAYWVISLVVFGAATTMMARAWAGRHPWLAVLLVTAIAAITPQWLLGTGSPLLAIALPGVLSGFLIYLATGALLIGRHRVAGLAAVATALVHVQQGAVVLVLLLAAAAVVFARTRKIDWWLAGSGLASAAIVFFGLRLRPVAGHLEDFAAACDKLIPFHCNATIWDPQQIAGGMALMAFAFLTIVYLARSDRWRWWVVVILPAVGLTAGVMVDRYDVPGLGVLAQGLNIYRLDVMMLPLAVWGMVAIIFARVGVLARWALLGLTMMLGYVALGQGGWILGYPRGGAVAFATLAVLILITLLMTVPEFKEYKAPAWTTAVLAVALLTLLPAFTSGRMHFRKFDPTFYNDAALRSWGEQVERVVPPGEQLLVSPTSGRIRQVTKRAIVVDCKYGPYGGDPWKQYAARMEALGGFDQCIRHTADFDRLAPAAVTAIAKRYGAGYLVVEDRQQWRLQAHLVEGWKVVLNPSGSVSSYVLKAPWAAQS